MWFGKVRFSDKLFAKVKIDEMVESPGMKYKHYAPKTRCILVKSAENQIRKINDLVLQNNNCCVLGFLEDEKYINIPSNRFINLGRKNNLKEISSNIFSSLTKLDKMGCELAIIEGVEESGLGLSIMNRLVRACEYNVM